MVPPTIGMVDLEGERAILKGLSTTVFKASERRKSHETHPKPKLCQTYKL